MTYSIIVRTSQCHPEVPEWPAWLWVWQTRKNGHIYDVAGHLASGAGAAPVGGTYQAAALMEFDALVLRESIKLTGDPNNSLYSCEDTIAILQKLNRALSHLVAKKVAAKEIPPLENGVAPPVQWIDSYVITAIHRYYLDKLKARRDIRIVWWPMVRDEDGREIPWEYADPSADTPAQAAAVASAAKVAIYAPAAARRLDSLLKTLGLTKKERRDAMRRVDYLGLLGCLDLLRDHFGLTDKETKVAILYIVGLSSLEIASKVGGTPNNVNQTMRRVRDHMCTTKAKVGHAPGSAGILPAPVCASDRPVSLRVPSWHDCNRRAGSPRWFAWGGGKRHGAYFSRQPGCSYPRIPSR
jgi:hypothetical protein